MVSASRASKYPVPWYGTYGWGMRGLTRIVDAIKHSTSTTPTVMVCLHWSPVTCSAVDDGAIHPSIEGDTPYTQSARASIKPWSLTPGGKFAAERGTLCATTWRRGMCNLGGGSLGTPHLFVGGRWVSGEAVDGAEVSVREVLGFNGEFKAEKGRPG